MVCPKCNNIIKDGYMLCNVCGYVIDIVPAYDAVLENQMDEAISAMLEGINLDEMTEADMQHLTENMDEETTREIKRRIELEKTRDLERLLKEKDNGSRSVAETVKAEVKNNGEVIKKTLVSCLAVFLILVIATGGIFYYRMTNSTAGLIAKAEKYQEGGDFERAEEVYEQALENSPQEKEAVLGLAFCRARNGKRDEAISLLLDYIHVTEDENAYEQLIALYEDEDEYGRIAVLLEKCRNETVRTIYSKYIVDVPQFDLEEGVYEGEISVKLMTNVPGHVYYTLDGSEPTEESTEYTEPIKLRNGKYVVRAIFVNGSGISSESSSHIYEVESLLPGLPSIEPESGTYDRAQYIKVSADEDCRIFYTDDGSMPDENSMPYEYPIAMQEGDSTYKFVAIASDGRRSDISSVNYSLKLTAVCLKDEAVNYVKTSLMAIGQLQDMSGKALMKEGSYSFECIGIIYADGYNYYLIEEDYSEAVPVSANSTGSYYAVNSMTGVLLRAVRNEEGYFTLSQF